MRLPGTTGKTEKAVMNQKQQGSRREGFRATHPLSVHNLTDCRDCLVYPGIPFCWRFLFGSYVSFVWVSFKQINHKFLAIIDCATTREWSVIFFFPAPLLLTGHLPHSCSPMGTSTNSLQTLTVASQCLCMLQHPEQLCTAQAKTRCK